MILVDVHIHFLLSFVSFEWKKTTSHETSHEKRQNNIDFEKNIKNMFYTPNKIIKNIE